jgi:hypothetical protein
LIITGLVMCWFAAQTLREGWNYFKLDARVSAQVLKWEVKMRSASRYCHFATYCYTVAGQEFIGQTLFSSPSYPNQYAAQHDLRERKKKEMEVWYQKKQPAVSSLQKKFPKKELTNCILTFGVMFYFYLVRGLVSGKAFSEISNSKFM